MYLPFYKEVMLPSVRFQGIEGATFSSGRNDAHGRGGLLLPPSQLCLEEVGPRFVSLAVLSSRCQVSRIFLLFSQKRLSIGKFSLYLTWWLEGKDHPEVLGLHQVLLSYLPGNSALWAVCNWQVVRWSFIF